MTQRFLPSLLGAAALHAAAFAWLASRPPPRLPERRPPTTVRLVTRERPPPAPVPAPPPPAEPPRPRPPPRIAEVRPTVAEPPRPAPPAPAAAPAPPPQPRRFAVSMDAVVPGGAGGVAVPVTEGATAPRGNPDAPASAPVGDNTAFATRSTPVDTIDVESPPRRRSCPSAEELRRDYPAAAREARLEADVRLELTIDEAGRVAAVRVVEPAGNGFDEVAVAQARRCTFSPALRGGRPQAVRIPFPVKFRLDE